MNFLRHVPDGNRRVNVNTTDAHVPFTHTRYTAGTHGGGLEGRHAHGELEAHGGCAARSMVVASARTTAAEIAARWCARKVRGEDRERGHTGWSHGWSARVRAIRVLATASAYWRVSTQRTVSARNGRSVARSKVGESASCVSGSGSGVFFSGRNPKNARLRASKEVGTDRWNGVN
jgi:hypothetical protein